MSIFERRIKIKVFSDTLFDANIQQPSVVSAVTSESGDRIYIIRIDPPDMIIFGYILESLEGWAFHTIHDREKCLLHVEVIADYVSDFEKLFLK
jgi:hypothetical protein